jgi:hypothetical protein
MEHLRCSGDGAPNLSPTSASASVYNNTTQINVDKSIQLRFGSPRGHQGEGVLWRREGDDQGACGVYEKLSEVHLGRRGVARALEVAKCNTTRVVEAADA